MGDVSPVLKGEVVVDLQDILEYFFRVAPCEGRVATEQDVEQHPHAPHIAALVIVAAEYLWCDVVRSAHDCF